MLDRHAFLLAQKSLAKNALPYVWARRSIAGYCFWFDVQGYFLRRSGPLRLPGITPMSDVLNIVMHMKLSNKEAAGELVTFSK